MNLKSFLKISKNFIVFSNREIAYYSNKPIIANLELTYRCNLRCKMCSLWKTSFESQKDELSLNEWKRVIDELSEMGIRDISLIGAEPLLRKDLTSIIDYMKIKNINSQITTNGVLITKGFARTIVNKLNLMTISIDAPNNNLHDEIRGVKGTLDQIKRGIDLIVTEKRKTNSKLPVLKIHTTVSSLNVKYLEKMHHFSRALNVEQLTFQYLSENKLDDIENTRLNETVIASDRFVPFEKSLLLNDTEIAVLKDQIKKLETISKHTNIYTGFAVLERLSNHFLRSGVFPVKRCYVVQNRIIVDPYGNLIPCAHLKYIFGNVRKQKIKDIWNNSKYKIFRKRLKQTLFPVCYNCCNHSYNFTPIQLLRFAFKKVVKRNG